MVLLYVNALIEHVLKGAGYRIVLQLYIYQKAAVERSYCRFLVVRANPCTPLLANDELLTVLDD